MINVVDYLVDAGLLAGKARPGPQSRRRPFARIGSKSLAASIR